MNYFVHGVVVASDVPLLELGLVPDQAPLLIVKLERQAVPDEGWSWIRPQPDVDEGHWLAVARQGRLHRLRFDGGADFVVSTEEKRIVVHVDDRHALGTIRHLLIDQVMPLILSYLGRFVLHASGFVLPEGAVALIGSGGTGKSTLSASFGLHGAAVLADDALVVEDVDNTLIATPAYSGIRVWPDVLPALGVTRNVPCVAPYTPKRRLGVDDGLRFAEDRIALRRVYALEPHEDDRIEIESLCARDAIMTLLGQTYVLDTSDRRRLGEQFAAVCSASAVADVRRLRYPRTFSVFPRVRDAILADLAG